MSSIKMKNKSDKSSSSFLSMFQSAETRAKWRLTTEARFIFTSTVVLVTCVKVLLIPAYYSTDFEVHRNWMAITSQLPLSKWYTDTTSQWTLDYPPFFAYFELCLSYIAPVFDAQMLQLSAKPYTSFNTVLYQRLTVIGSDFVYYYAVWCWLCLLIPMVSKSGGKFTKTAGDDTNDIQQHGLLQCARGFPLSPQGKIQSTVGRDQRDRWSSPTLLYTILFLFNTGHLLVDHIHFQYNGLLNGILLLSLVRMIRGQIYWSAFWFTILINLKHIYLYMAPAYFLFLLFDHCIIDGSTINTTTTKTSSKQQQQNGLIITSSNIISRIRFTVLLSLGTIVLSIFAISFGPFFAMGKFGALMARLFPFQRGLSHAYWAPNFWALYNAADLVLAKVMLKRQSATGTSTGTTSGLVQVSHHQVLPSITPLISLICVATLLMIIFSYYLWQRMKFLSSSSSSLYHLRQPRFLNRLHRRSSVLFLELVLLCTLTFFTTGYHVHEKAILLVFPPLIPLILAHRIYARVFLLLSTVGYFSLFPLLYREAETPIKCLLLAIHVVYTSAALSAHYPTITNGNNKTTTSLLNIIEKCYLLTIIPLQLIYSIGPMIVPKFFSHYQFVPLLSISVYSAIGVCYCFILLMTHFIQSAQFVTVNDGDEQQWYGSTSPTTPKTTTISGVNNGANNNDNDDAGGGGGGGEQRIRVRSRRRLR